ncbi:MAG: SPFH domain-containing protein, partial [Candidatus Lokiarchaeota archaeon]
EKLLFYNKAELVDVLDGGVYELNKREKMKGLELVWIDTSFVKIQWGIPQSEGIPTKDGMFIGLHGDLNLKISSPKIFYTDVVAGRKNWNIKDLKNWIKGLMHTSLRDIFKNYTAKDILLEDRERVLNQSSSMMIEELLRYGLELDSINILGIKAPEGTENLFRVEREKAKIKDDQEILKAKGELEAKRRFFKVESVKIESSKEKKTLIKQQMEELRDKLDQFDDMLAADKISKEIYEMRVKRIEKELDGLTRRLRE